jgi:hypothetical protein
MELPYRALRFRTFKPGFFKSSHFYEDAVKYLITGQSKPMND